MLKKLFNKGFHLIGCEFAHFTANHKNQPAEFLYSAKFAISAITPCLGCSHMYISKPHGLGLFHALPSFFPAPSAAMCHRPVLKRQAPAQRIRQGRAFWSCVVSGNKELVVPAGPHAPKRRARAMLMPCSAVMQNQFCQRCWTRTTVNFSPKVEQMSACPQIPEKH